jgi:hypothetical protein
MPYLKARAEGLDIEWAPPTYPPSLRDYFERPTQPGVYAGKKILSIHGGADKLVPYHLGKDEIARIAEAVKAAGSDSSGAVGGKGELEVKIMEGSGHIVNAEMVRMTAEWVWKWALSAESGSESESRSEETSSSGFTRKVTSSL